MFSCVVHPKVTSCESAIPSGRIKCYNRARISVHVRISLASHSGKTV